MKILNSFLKYNGWKYFTLLVGFTVLTVFAINFLFLSDGLFYQSYGEQLAADRIAQMIEVTQKWQWLGYIFIPVAVLIRICFTAICIYTGCFLANIKVSFVKLFKVALLADFVFVFAGIVKLVVLIFFRNVSTFNDLQFQPLSLLELFDYKSIDTFLIYPLTLISIFELLYWLALAWLLSVVIEKPFGNSLRKIASSYGTGLLLWVLFVMFLTINLT